MKIGICINMNSTAPNKTGLEHVELYRNAGFDYLELPGGAMLIQPPRILGRMEERLLSCGLPCLAISSLVHPSVRLTGEAVVPKTVERYFDSAFALGKRLGARYFIFGSSGARNVPFGFPVRKAWSQIIDLLRRLGPQAAEAGITIVIEHINRLEGNIIDTFAQGVEAVREVDHPNVRCLVDYFHLGLGREDLEPVRGNIGLIKHAHTANLVGRTIPTPCRHDEGEVEFLQCLKDCGYEGGVSVEGYSRDIWEEAGSSMAFMRKFK